MNFTFWTRTPFSLKSKLHISLTASHLQSPKQVNQHCYINLTKTMFQNFVSCTYWWSIQEIAAMAVAIRSGNAIMTTRECHFGAHILWELRLVSLDIHNRSKIFPLTRWSTNHWSSPFLPCQTSSSQSCVSDVNLYKIEWIGRKKTIYHHYYTKKLIFRLQNVGISSASDRGSTEIS